jgi:uncharacterized membrane-anchored protein YhcB (DUF1043 family)
MSMRKKIAVSAPLPNLYRTCLLLPTLILCVALAGIFQDQVHPHLVTLFQSTNQQHDSSRSNNHMNMNVLWTPQEQEQQHGKQKSNSMLWTQLLPNTFQSSAVFAVVLVEHKHQQKHKRDKITFQRRNVDSNVFPFLDKDVVDGDETLPSSKPFASTRSPSRPASERARLRRHRREALEQQQRQTQQSLLPSALVPVDQLRTAIQHLFGAEQLEQAAAQQCQRRYGSTASTSTSTSNNDTESELCETAAVSVYDKEADYNLQATGWLVATPSRSDADAMAAKLNQVELVQAIGTVYAVRVHVDSCDATYVQYAYAAADSGSGIVNYSAAAQDDNNNRMVRRNVDDISSNNRSHGVVQRHFCRIVQFWKRLRQGFRQLRKRLGKRQQQKPQPQQQKQQTQHQQHKQKREPKQEEQQNQKQYSRTSSNTTTVLRSPSLWLVAARTLVPGRDRFQCLIRTESSVQTQLH